VQDNETSRSNEFGGSLGGPIVRDACSSYGAYSPRNTDSATLQLQLPTATRRFSAKSWQQAAFGK
jgi:hypothetical protein